MKFQVDRQRFLEAMQVLVSIVPPRTIKPILNNVRIVTEGGSQAALLATDLEISLRYNLPLLALETPGEVLINAQRLTSILRETLADTVEIDDEDVGKVRLRAGRSNFHLLSEDAAEFPTIDEFREDQAFGLNRDKFVTLIRKTQFAVAKEKSRFGFNGAKLHIEGNEARMIATDGKRLAMKVETIDNSDGISAGHIVPSRALSVFERVLTNEDDSVRIALDDNQIMIMTSRAQLTSRLVDGSFPNYNSVIPRDCPINVIVDRNLLSSAFRQASLLTSQETRSVKMTFAESKATLRAQALDAGEAEIEIDIEGYVGAPMTVAFNPEYVHEGLKAMDVEKVTISMSKPTQPAKFLGEENFVYVVMPVTLRSA